MSDNRGQHGRHGQYVSTQRALGDDRVQALLQLAPRIDELNRLTLNVNTVDMLIQPLTESQLPLLLSFASSRPTENWRAVKLATGQYLALQGVPRSLNDAQLLDAFFYPELHTRLLVWWLSHAWRVIELATATLQNLHNWDITLAALTSRGLIEQVGCLYVELRTIAARWTEAKALVPQFTIGDEAGRENDLILENRSLKVRSLLHGVLYEFAFASRGLGEASEGLAAKNVQGYVQRLTKASGVDFEDMYAWLSNAAHPAVGARVLYASEPNEHVTETSTIRFYSRYPTVVQQGGAERRFIIADYAAMGALSASDIGIKLLWKSLRLIDDFGLTTGAASLTNVSYWRNLGPVGRNLQCPCGCGKYKRHRHNWGEPTPDVAFAPKAAK